MCFNPSHCCVEQRVESEQIFWPGGSFNINAWILFKRRQLTLAIADIFSYDLPARLRWFLTVVKPVTSSFFIRTCRDFVWLSTLECCSAYIAVSQHGLHCGESALMTLCAILFQLHVGLLKPDVVRNHRALYIAWSCHVVSTEFPFAILNSLRCFDLLLVLNALADCILSNSLVQLKSHWHEHNALVTASFLGLLVLVSSEEFGVSKIYMVLIQWPVKPNDSACPFLGFTFSKYLNEGVSLASPFSSSSLCVSC